MVIREFGMEREVMIIRGLRTWRVRFALSIPDSAGSGLLAPGRGTCGFYTPLCGFEA